MFEQISKEDAIKIAKEFNETHPTQLKYITKNSEGVWEGWNKEPILEYGIWDRAKGGCFPVILNPIVHHDDWEKSLTAIEN